MQSVVGLRVRAWQCLQTEVCLVHCSAALVLQIPPQGTVRKTEESCVYGTVHYVVAYGGRRLETTQLSPPVKDTRVDRGGQGWTSDVKQSLGSPSQTKRGTCMLGRPEQFLSRGVFASKNCIESVGCTVGSCVGEELASVSLGTPIYHP